MDKTLEKRVQQLSAVIANKTDILSGQRIDKASYDKTLIGIVAEKIIPQNPKDDNDFKWQIQANGAAYNISPAACNITEVGQRVRLYLPNHDYREKYAEVIAGNSLVGISVKRKDKAITDITFNYDNESSVVYSVEYNDEKKVSKFGNVVITWEEGENV